MFNQVLWRVELVMIGWYGKGEVIFIGCLLCAGCFTILCNVIFMVPHVEGFYYLCYRDEETKILRDEINCPQSCGE